MQPLIEAINTVEQNLQAYSGATAQTGNDQSAADALKAKLDAANAQVATDLATQANVANILNDALDALSEAALASKIPVSLPAPPVIERSTAPAR